MQLFSPFDSIETLGQKAEKLRKKDSLTPMEAEAHEQMLKLIGYKKWLMLQDLMKIKSQPF